MDAAAPTTAKKLKAAGYAIAHFGKGGDVMSMTHHVLKPIVLKNHSSLSEAWVIAC